ncbi:MAG: flagellar motor protein MotD [Myxococcales bacterium]|nr:flagellar motor protein MotD [Myxococcales bacterium]
MAKKKKHPEHVNLERWLISYADFITLLFAFFVVMFSVSQVDTAKLGKLSESFAESFGIHVLAGNPGLFDGQNSPFKWVRPSGAKGVQKSTEAVIALEAAMRIHADDEAKDVLPAVAKSRPESALAPELSLGLKVLRRRHELVLRLDQDVLFESGADGLSEKAAPLLEVIGKELKGRSVSIRVEGHTDSRPISTAQYRSNWHLSTARATAVIVYFLEKSGIDPALVSAAGHGEFQPVASNETPEGRAKNRRVDIVISAGADPNEEELDGAGGETGDSPASPENEKKKAADSPVSPEPEKKKAADSPVSPEPEKKKAESDAD